MDNAVVIVAASRTPIGAFQGVLAPVTAPQLGAAARFRSWTRRRRRGIAAEQHGRDVHRTGVVDGGPHRRRSQAL